MVIVPAIFGALLGALLTVCVQSLFAVRNADLSALNDQITEIGAIERLAVEYWLADGPDQQEAAQVQAARLRGAIAATLEFRQTAERIFRADFKSYNDLDFELFDSATGGAFEQISRKADPERAILVIETCNRLRARLRVQRRNIFWAH